MDYSQFSPREIRAGLDVRTESTYPQHVNNLTAYLHANSESFTQLRSLRENPYQLTEVQRQLLDSNNIPSVETAAHDNARAFLLAFKSSRYDKAEAHSQFEQRVICLAKLTVKLTEHIEQADDSIWTKDNATLYSELYQKIKEEDQAKVLTESDLTEVQLSIINYLQALQVIKDYRQEYLQLGSDQEKKVFIEKIFGVTLDFEVQIDFSVSGIAIRVFQEDFKKLNTTRFQGTVVPLGLALTKDTVFKDSKAKSLLPGKIVLINLGPQAKPRSKKDADETEKHELSHLRFNLLYVKPDYQLHHSDWTQLETLDQVVDTARIQRFYRSEHAKNEVIAYCHNDQVLPSDLASYGGDFWKNYFEEILNSLPENVTKEQVYPKLLKEYQAYLRDLMLFINLAVESLGESMDGDIAFTKEEVLAVLAMADLNKVRRTSKILKLKYPPMIQEDDFSGIWTELQRVDQLLKAG